MKSSFFTSLVLVTWGFAASSCSQQSSNPTAKIVPPEPYTYFPVSFRGANIELLAKLDTVTPITLINHSDGSVSQTLTDKTGTRDDEYRGRYDYTSLKASPSWNSSENYIQKVSAITALIGVDYTAIQVLYPKVVSDPDLARELDSKVRKEALIDSAIYTMDIKQRSAEEYLNSLKDKLPTISELELSGREVLLISYELADIAPGKGPQLLAVGDQIIPLKGSCASAPHFYAIGDHLYFRLLTGLCESGFILVENYIILDDSIKQEWTTGVYAN